MGTRAGRVGRPSGPPAFLLLVLAVLTGLVAMHGLGPGGLPGPTGPDPSQTGAVHTRAGALRTGTERIRAEAGPHSAGAVTVPAAVPVHTEDGRPGTRVVPRTGAVRAHTPAASGQGAAEAAAPADDACGCTHADVPAHGGRDGGHAEHADPTCAASGTSGAPVLPAQA
ncbi:hypothetical protein, partial [Streptomyces sp. NPDC089915]|uniref:DUF6153 family protein n=1 Tax=Streptomyces sp. NPDC089915 TaxID=3155186 RepID=UPI0034340157